MSQVDANHSLENLVDIENMEKLTTAQKAAEEALDIMNYSNF